MSMVEMKFELTIKKTEILTDRARAKMSKT